ncbi:LRR receptor-like serine/threonine-protein kinase FEI 1 [Capsicum annuum]|uniref:LRR receptor-like serine/threonine-protein kinase FEI 1 n=1 Tax=Capsicum annuum TaxID=4072 RepID=UPI001FB0A5B9|nr:LRR receptor-like serine/threonine-protein kinase FEI 1 [Capsicum annuum]
MPNGSLEKYLYSHNYFLDIMQRLSIMIDVACALEYLHHGCSPPVIQCDLKPINVLLDKDMVAHLRDFGILKLLGEDESDLYTKTLATLGYIAPDANLVPPTDNHLLKKLDCVASIMNVTLDCCAESPTSRTSMKDVVGMLQKI